MMLWRVFVNKPLFPVYRPQDDIVMFLSAQLKTEQQKYILLRQEMDATKQDLAAQKIYSGKLNDKIDDLQRASSDQQKQLEICNAIKDMMVRQSFDRDITVPLQRKRASEVHALICERLSLDELKEMCFKMDIDHDSLEGETLPSKALSLIKRLIRRKRFDEFLNLLHDSRPDVEWPL